MSYRHVPLELLVINRANDRHGELENETAAIAWLFNNFEQHMRNLAKDIVETGQIFETPLVFPEDDKFIVFDGNRRTTCLKLLDKPKRAPTIELQEFLPSNEQNGKVIFRVQSNVRSNWIVTGLTIFSFVATPERKAGLAKPLGMTG